MTNNLVVLADSSCENPESLASEILLQHGAPTRMKSAKMREEDYKLMSLLDGRAKCLVCGKIYTTRENARHHFRNFHGSDPPVRIQCTLCGSYFPQANHFRVHINRSHKIVGVKNVIGTYGLYVDPESYPAHP